MKLEKVIFKNLIGTVKRRDIEISGFALRRICVKTLVIYSQEGDNMLHLKRVQYFTDFIRCHISQKILAYGDYYYEDDEDGLIVDALVYHKIKEKKKAEEFDYSKLEKAQSEKEYREILAAAERELKENTLLDRKVFHKGAY